MTKNRQNMFVPLFIALIFIETQFEVYLHHRQRQKVIASTEAPEVFREFYTADEFSAAREYEMDKSFFKMISIFYSGIIWIVLIPLIPRLWKIIKIQGEYKKSVIFAILFASLILSSKIPFKYYNTFVLEEKHGFNKSTIQLFVMDNVKIFAILVVYLIILVPLFTKIYKVAGKYFVPIGCTVYIIIVVITQLIFPTFILPLFTKLTPLQEGPIFDAVMKLSNETQFPVTEMYSADDSKRSSHQNAMVFGLFTKKIAIADTLLNVSTPDTIAAVVGHEIGHSKHHHIIKIMGIEVAQALIVFGLLYIVMNTDKVFKDLGFDEKPFIVGLILFYYLYSPVDSLMQLPVNTCIRYFEFQADHYSASRGLPLDIALLKLAHDNKMAIEPDSLYFSFYHSHPTIPQRVKRIREIFAEIKKE